MEQALITAGIAATAIVIGWFVIGTQHVTEELTSKRQEAYAKVVAEADCIAADRDHSHHDFIQAVWAADFVCSDRMHKANRLPALLEDIRSQAWATRVDEFYELARFESHRNSILRRWYRRKRYDRVPVRRPARLAQYDLEPRTDDRGGP